VVTTDEGRGVLRFFGVSESHEQHGVAATEQFHSIISQMGEHQNET
jgi:hypothetical protein